MKSHKYSLFLSVASVCMLSSTLVAADVISAPVTAQLGNGSITVDQGKKAKKAKPTPEEIAQRQAAKAAEKAKSQEQQSKLVEQVVDASGNPVKTEENHLGNLFDEPKTTAPVIVTSPQVGAEQQHDPLAPVVAAPQNLTGGVQLGLPVAHDPLTAAPVVQQHDPLAPVVLASPQNLAPGVQQGLPVAHDPLTAAPVVQQHAPLAPVVLASPQNLAPGVQQGLPVAHDPLTAAPVVQQHDPLAPVVLASPQNLAPGVQLGLPVAHDQLTAAPVVQQHDPLAPVVAAPQNLAPVIDPNAVEKATIKQVENALATPDAEKVVAQLVEKELQKKQLEGELASSKVDLTAEPTDNVANDVVAAPVKKTKQKLTEAQVVALGSAKAKIAADPGAVLSEEELAALAAVEAIKAAKAQNRAEAAAAGISLLDNAGKASKKSSNPSKQTLTPEQITALKAAKARIAAKNKLLAGAELTEEEKLLATAAHTEEELAALAAAAAVKAGKKASPVVTESVEPNLDALFEAPAKKDDASAEQQSSSLTATINAPAPVVDDLAVKKIETITQVPAEKLTAEIVLNNGIPSLTETMKVYNITNEPVKNEAVKTGEVAVNASNDSNAAPKPLTPEEEAAAKKKAEEEAEAAKKKSAESGDKAAPKKEESNAAPKTLTAEEEAEAAKKKAEEEEAAKKKAATVEPQRSH